MQSLSIERALATRLSHVDIIVGGGSNTLLANHNKFLHKGDSAAGSYPLLYTSPDNEPVLLVNIDGDYRYLGRLVIEFDADGRVITNSINNHDSGPWASSIQVLETLAATPDAEVTAVADV